MLREKVLPCEPADASSPSLVHEGSLGLLVVLQSARVLCLGGFLYCALGFEMCWLCG